MQATKDTIFIITTMDGVPVTKADGSIMQFLDTISCRYNAKIRTFANATRYHSRALTKKQFFAAKKEYLTHWVVSMNNLGWKGDHN